MLDRIRNLRYIHFLIASLVAAAAVLLIKDAGSWIHYRNARSSGIIVTERVDLSECRFESLKSVAENVYAATDRDPQIIFDVDGYVASLRIEMTTYLEPGEIPVYYTVEPDAGFNDTYMEWAHPSEDGAYEVVFGERPPEYVSKIRIDPTVYAGNRIELKEILINPALKAGDLMDIGAVFFFRTLLYGAIVSVILRSMFSKKEEPKE